MNNGGFTLIEILIALTLGVILTTAGFISYQGLKDRRDVELTLRELTSTVRETQNRSTTQQDGDRWSIRFTASSTGSDTYDVYTGTTYSSSSLVDSHSFTRPVHFSEPSDNRTVDFQFDPVSGKIDNKKIVTITHSKNNSTAADVIVNTLGQVTQKMLDDISGYWHMDEGTGTTTADASGQGLTGSFNGDPTWLSAGSCVAGQCLDMDGSGDYVSTGVSGNELGRLPLTIAFWGKMTLTGDFYSLVKRTMPAANGSTAYTQGYTVLIDSDDSLGLRIDTTESSNNTIYPSSPDISDGDWHHLAAVMEEGGTARVYVDGSEIASSTFSGGFDSSGGTFGFPTGGSADMGTSISSNIEVDEVQAYTRALAASEIEDLYDNLR